VQLYPAIDVQDGRAARAVGAADPEAAAHALAAAGVAWAHVVDLDRALGTGRNDETVRAVITALQGVRVQLGGGLAEPAEVREAISWGVARVVVGSGALPMLGRLVEEHGAARLGLAVTASRGPHPLAPAPVGSGGTTRLRPMPEDLVTWAVESGVQTVVYRDRDRDGTLAGADVGRAGRLLGRGADIILAGGVATLDELRRARDLGFAGVIVGRALLTGRFTLAQAIACCG
jgi:phosphoribosylformimino-5-aminoimidazole carboxamide ribonucleotide (ProFAR) isomerase